MRRRIGLLLLGGIATAAGSGAALALEPPRPVPLSIGRSLPEGRLTPSAFSLATLPHATATPSGAFMTSYLAPQMARRLAPLGEWFASPTLEREARRSSSWLEMQENAEQQAWKATRKAVRSWLGDRLDSEITIAAGLPSGSTSTRGGTRVSFGIASLTPRIIVERGAGNGFVRFGVDAGGDVNVDWRPASGETRLGATFDADSRRLGFNVAGRF
jgi:hypothetical protein